MMIVDQIVDLQGLKDVVDVLSQHCQLGDVVLLEGEMGAGKTTLTRLLMDKMGYEGVTSPTFTLANVYKAKKVTVFHLDLYRIDQEQDLLSMDIERYLNDDQALCLVEWPSRLGVYKPRVYLEVQILLLEDMERRRILIKRIC
eukprot:COSAG01_NODE_216_length_21695_cov_83.368772_5_plen_143_part_00